MSCRISRDRNDDRCAAADFDGCLGRAHRRRLFIPSSVRNSRDVPGRRAGRLVAHVRRSCDLRPTAEPFRLDKVADGITPGGYYYAANNLFTSEHGGTHVDAPLHFAEGHQAVDQIPLDRLVGPAVVVDVTDRSNGNADYQVTAEDLQRSEGEHGAIPPDSILLVRTGYSSRWPDAARYLGTAERGQQAVAKLHFPGLHPDAARWLIANRRIKAIGIDTASIDYGQSTAFESHRLLYERDIPAFENLTALDQLPARGAWIVALPMKIRGGSGAPLRAMAIVPR
jgi:kynurenine formamidase